MKPDAGGASRVVVPLVDLRPQHATLKEELGRVMSRVLERGQFVLGEEVERFEQEFAAYCRARYAIGVNSGTSALHLALLAAGVGPGDEVLTVPLTFVATVAAILYTRARPVLVDVDPDTLTMAPELIEPAITPRTRAVVPVHLHGRPAAMGPIVEIARRRGLVVIEDAAQAHGAEHEGGRVGSLGDLACFSFYPTKNLGACGEAGAITTSNPVYAETIRMLRDWGQAGKYRHVLLGFNYRLEALQAAILRVKLAWLEGWTEARRAHAARYDSLLADSGVRLPVHRAGDRHVYHVYAVRVADRDGAQRALEALGIQTGIHYPVPVHLQEGYRGLGYHAGDFPTSELAAREVLSLPMYPELTAEAVERVARAVRTVGTVAHGPDRAA